MTGSAIAGYRARAAAWAEAGRIEWRSLRAWSGPPRWSAGCGSRRELRRRAATSGAGARADRR
jgi:hypothetical protein